MQISKKTIKIGEYVAVTPLLISFILFNLNLGNHEVAIWVAALGFLLFTLVEAAQKKFVLATGAFFMFIVAIQASLTR